MSAAQAKPKMAGIGEDIAAGMRARAERPPAATRALRHALPAVLLVASGLFCGHAAARPATARAEDAAATTVEIKLLGLNDFHGQLEAGRSFQGRPVGSAPVLAAYLRAATVGFEDRTLIVHAGDWVGASPPSSALLQDEPSLELLNLLGNRACSRRAPRSARCNLVAAPGNHEFDEGVSELMRLLRGGNHARGPFLGPYRGITFPYLAANVIEVRSGRPLLAASVVKELGGVRIGVIGAVTEDTPSLVAAEGIRSVRFDPAAPAINREVQRLKRRGIETIVVTVHKGGAQEPYEGPTRPAAQGPREGIVELIDALDDAVDVVVSGHAHAFTNALMNNANGHAILVTQAASAGTAYADISLLIDRARGEVIEKSARILPTWADHGPGLNKAPDVEALVERAKARVAPLTSRVVGHVSVALPAELDAAGESALGDLIADAQRASAGAEIALMNAGGIRTGLAAGEVTWGELFAIQPFANTLVSMDLTGAQIARALAQQWQGSPTHFLAISGLRYRWDPARPPAQRVVAISVADAPLVLDRVYRVVVNNFLASGGNGFSVFLEGKNRRVGAVDLDALVSFLSARPGYAPAREARVTSP